MLTKHSVILQFVKEVTIEQIFLTCYSVTDIIKKKHLYKMHFQICPVDLSQNLRTVRYMHLFNHKDNKLSPLPFYKLERNFMKKPMGS